MRCEDNEERLSRKIDFNFFFENFCNSKLIAKIFFGQMHNCRRAPITPMSMRTEARQSSTRKELKTDGTNIFVMEEVVIEKNSNKGRENGLPEGSGNGEATINKMNLATLITGWILDEANGNENSASGLPATGVTCRKEREKGDEEENEREIPLVTPVKAWGSLLSPLQQLWTPLFLLALTRVRGSLIQLHTGFQRGLDWIKMTSFSQETLRV